MGFDNDRAQGPAAQTIDGGLEQIFRVRNHRKEAGFGPRTQIATTIGLHDA